MSNVKNNLKFHYRMKIKLLHLVILLIIISPFLNKTTFAITCPSGSPFNPILNICEPTGVPGRQSPDFSSPSPSGCDSGYERSPISNTCVPISKAGSVSSCNFKSVKNFRDLVTTLISCLLNPLVTLMVGLSIVAFLWGVFKFMRALGDDKQEGKELMFWGIIGIFVIVSLWGIVNILHTTFILG